MPDFRSEIRARMKRLNLAPETKEEIVAELASHFEDAESESAKERDNISQVKWRKLATAIEHAKRGTVMNHRIKSLWLPSLANLAALIALVILFYRMDWQEPGMATPGHVGRAFRIPFLLLLPALGALGSFLAKRARASRRERLIAGLVPSLLWFGVLVLVGLPLAFDPQDFTGIPMSYLGLSALGLVIVPALLLLAGSLPFLGNSHPGSGDSTESHAA